MSKDSWVISDTHFGCERTLKFRKETYSKFEAFTTSAESDEFMIANWNRVVKEHDRIYHLGDVLMPRKSFHLLKRLNGKKILIKGNHDIFKLKDYIEHFEDIRAYKVFDDMILSHMPIHVDSLIGRNRVNVHGHTHMKHVGSPLYFNVCVEHTDYTPINLEEIRERISRNDY